MQKSYGFQIESQTERIKNWNGFGRTKESREAETPPPNQMGTFIWPSGKVGL